MTQWIVDAPNRLGNAKPGGKNWENPSVEVSDNHNMIADLCMKPSTLPNTIPWMFIIIIVVSTREPTHQRYQHKTWLSLLSWIIHIPIQINKLFYFIEELLKTHEQQYKKMRINVRTQKVKKDYVVLLLIKVGKDISRRG